VTTDPEDHDADPEVIAREIALRLLDARPRTRHELATALARRRVPDDAATTVLDRLSDVGLVDDELRRKGIDRTVAEDALGAITVDDEIAAAREIVARRLRSMPDDLTRVARSRRLFGLLARKGIPAGVAQRVVREALDVDQVDESELGFEDSSGQP